jgi:hypothetical protein
VHSFEPEIAARVGVNAAVLYQNILWWSRKNAANGRHIMDGYAWTYNSRRAFADLFPYMTEKQIRTALDRLLECGLLVKGEYNAASYDRTNWYAPTCSAEWVKTIGLGGPLHWPSGADALGAEGQPIPDSKPVGKPDGKPLGDFDAFWAEVPRKKSKEDARRAYDRALKKTDHATLMAGIRRYAEERKNKDPKYTAYPATWLNDGGWQDEPDASHQDFHKQMEDIFNGFALRDARGDDSAGAEYLPAPIQDAGSLRPRDGSTAHPNDGGRYQQEVARIAQSKRFGRSAF